MQIKVRLFVFVLLSVSVASALGQNTSDHRLFIMGNSTIDHQLQAIPTPSDETSVPHWVYLFAQEANASFAAGGDFGFLTQHDDLNFNSNLGWDIVPGVWDADQEPFADADISSVMFTTANFIQYVGPDDAHPLDAATSVVQSTELLMDWVDQQESGVRYYLYENWPEMDLQQAFPPNLPAQSEIDDYHNETTGPFHDWWLDYQDLVLASRPELNVRMIPVGRILSQILRDEIPGQIPFDEVYEDSAPHGRATLYFLAGMITYMGMYEEITPTGYAVPAIIHPVVRDNYQSLADFIWAELSAFTDDEGRSRVFFNTTTSVSDVDLVEDCIVLNPNPSSGIFTISGMLSAYHLDIIDAQGHVFESLDTEDAALTIDINDLPAGLYFIRMQNKSNLEMSLTKILKQ